jgi:hypothetical protein
MSPSVEVGSETGLMTKRPERPSSATAPRTKKALPSGSREPAHAQATADKFTPKHRVNDWGAWRSRLKPVVLSSEYPSVDVVTRRLAAAAWLVAVTKPSLDTPLEEVFSESAISATLVRRAGGLGERSVQYLASRLREIRNLVLGLGVPAGFGEPRQAPVPPDGENALETLTRVAPHALSPVRETLRTVLDCLAAPPEKDLQRPVSPEAWGAARRWVASETDFLTRHSHIRAMEWRNLKNCALLPLLSQETPIAEVLVQMGVSHGRLDSTVAMLRLEPERASMTRVTDPRAA